MRQQRIDIDLTLAILERFNAGRYDHVRPLTASGIPTVDGQAVVDRTAAAQLSLPLDSAAAQLERLLPGVPVRDLATVRGSECSFSASQLTRLGRRLLPRLSYGVLNGGSATSYADEKKNRGLSDRLFRLLQDDFETLAELSRGRAKGLTPAYINGNGTPGASFLELKMRSNLIHALHYQRAFGSDAGGLIPLFPMFQMTSVYNSDEVASAYDQYRSSPMLQDLIEATGIDITRVMTGVQPLLAAYTHSAEGRPRRVFDRAWGKPHTALPLPGGHGQNFAVLKQVYAELYRIGKRFVYLGNVDNLGFTVDAISLAWLALSGKQAAFDFSFRTSVDIKGGILVRDQRGALACADIGPAISSDEVFRAEADGERILFNCATGLFRLDYLVEQIDRIIEELPMRFSDQDKDAGRYSQAEQVTWEIIGLLDDFIVFGVDKYDRFLAAKLLLETLMTSGRRLDLPDYPTGSEPSTDLRGTARRLHAGLERALTSTYGLRRHNGRWFPLAPSEIETP
ncbi:MAG: hypothetical protein EA384_05475 [Spirochaetaceae bacterium]|nr:MAG: hypothetical protein EA384_05475 [Spirochaetaceae bacterium]